MNQEKDVKPYEKTKAYKRAERNQLVAEELFKVLQNNQLSLLDTENVLLELKHMIMNRIHM